MPQDWCLADGSQIPKEKNSIGIGNFRPIPLLNVEGKILFGVVASRMTNFLMDNEFIDTPGIQGFPGYLEHAKMIWNSIRMAKQGQRELHVVWLHLSNAYGSVPHDLIYRYFDFFYIPEKIKGLLDLLSLHALYYPALHHQLASAGGWCHDGLSHFSTPCHHVHGDAAPGSQRCN